MGGPRGKKPGSASVLKGSAANRVDPPANGSQRTACGNDKTAAVKQSERTAEVETENKQSEEAQDKVLCN
jgi:hypothetical protein